MPSSRTGTTRLGRPFGGTLGILNTPVPPTATAPPYPSTSLEPAIKGLITPGLVPDIARQSAEVAAGHGIAGSPAADSLAVHMSEQNYLQRLGLANTLLSGESDRTLPYQITPYQSAEIALKKQALDDALRIAAQRWPGGVQHQQGGGGAAGNPGGPWSTNTGVTIGQYPTPQGPFTGTMPSGVSSAFPTGGAGGAGGGTSLWGGAGVGGPLGGPGGGNLSLDDIYEMLGFGQFGSQPGDTSTGSPDLGYLNE